MAFFGVAFTQLLDDIARHASATYSSVLVCFFQNPRRMMVTTDTLPLSAEAA